MTEPKLGTCDNRNVGPPLNHTIPHVKSKRCDNWRESAQPSTMKESERIATKAEGLVGAFAPLSDKQIDDLTWEAAQPEAGEPRIQTVDFPEGIDRDSGQAWPSAQGTNRTDGRTPALTAPNGAPAVEPLTAEQFWERQPCDEPQEWGELRSYEEIFKFAEAFARQVRQEAEPRYGYMGLLWWNGLGHMPPDQIIKLKADISRLTAERDALKDALLAEFKRLDARTKDDEGNDLDAEELIRILGDRALLSHQNAKIADDKRKLTEAENVRLFHGTKEANSQQYDATQARERAEAALREQLAISGQLQARLTMAEKDASEAKNIIRKFLNNGPDFDGTGFDCYCGAVMGEDGDLDEKAKCIVCLAQAALKSKAPAEEQKEKA